MADPRPSTVSCDELTVPACLESPRSKLLYLTLAVTGSARADELRSVLRMSSLSLFPIIQDLREAGIVERAEDGAFRLVDVEATAIEAR